jgi:hypothetical protein
VEIIQAKGRRKPAQMRRMAERARMVLARGSQRARRRWSESEAGVESAKTVEAEDVGDRLLMSKTLTGRRC